MASGSLQSETYQVASPELLNTKHCDSVCTAGPRYSSQTTVQSEMAQGRGEAGWILSRGRGHAVKTPHSMPFRSPADRAVDGGWWMSLRLIPTNVNHVVACLGSLARPGTGRVFLGLSACAACTSFDGSWVTFPCRGDYFARLSQTRRAM